MATIISIAKLNQWLRRRDNSPSKLARLLGYKYPSTIYNWQYRGRIPLEAQLKIKELFDLGVK